jgi:AmmeMemoRadiSam system protein B
LPYRTAQATDLETVQAILGLRGPLTHQQACGGTPVNGLLLAARQHALKPALLGLCNSGDSCGDRQRVVGYASFVFTEPAHASD